MKEPIRVLIVEDSEDDAELLMLALDAEGFAPTANRVVDEASLRAALADGPWDVVISDFNLPQFTAFETLEALRQSGVEAPLIVVSGAIGEEMAVALIKAGAHDFFMKDQLARLGRAVRREMAETRSRIERRRAEQALREAEDRYRATIDAASDAIITADSGTIVTANTAAERIFGFEPGALIGLPLTAVLPDASPSDAGTREATGRHRSGRPIDLEVTLGQIIQHGARLHSAIARDVTERKQAEAERERLYEETRRASRMKDEFLATLSHELRTPLYVIAGHAELLALEEPGTQEFGESLDAIRKHAKIQTQLINDLLDVSRFITGKLSLHVRPVNLRGVLDATIETMRLAADAKGLTVRADLSAMAGAVAGDPDRLQQVFWNLLSNAVKFTPPGGRIDVNLERHETRAIVRIKDSGKGIEPAFLPYVFERFRQEDSSSTRVYGGLGLGLAIVRHLVELHGGTVGVHSDGKDSGSTFTVDLPLAGLATVAPPQPTEQAVTQAHAFDAALRSLSGKHILVVDDQADARRMIGKILAKAGARVDVAGSVREAIQQMQAATPDVLLCDIGMPNEDGYVLIRALRGGDDARLRKLPAIALTAYAAEADRRRALAEGFDEHLGKPITPAVLVERLATLTSKRIAPPS